MRTHLRAFVALAVLFAPAAALAQKVQVEPDTPAYQNVETGIQFLRDHGDDTAADEIQKSLDDGEIYSDPDVDGYGETTNLNDVKIAPGVLGHNNARGTDRTFDSGNDNDYRAIVTLAQTLYHENIHRNHQNYLYWTWTFYTDKESNKGENDAWSQTLDAMDRWLTVEANRFGPDYTPTATMTPEAYQRELRHIREKISFLTSLYADWKSKGYYRSAASDTKKYVEFDVNYWKDQDATHIAQRIVRRQPADEPQNAGGGTGAAADGLAGTQPEPPTPPTPSPAPMPQPKPVAAPPPPCEPCRPIAAAIAQLRAQLQTVMQDKANADDALDKVNHQLDQLRKRADSLNRQLQRSGGTGGSSYDPATGIHIDAYDQGDGTVRVTTRDANGRVIDDHVRDASARKAELRQQLDAANAEINRLLADQAQAKEASAKAEAAVDALTAELQKQIAELAACIAKYCNGLSVAESLNMLGLPFPSLNVLADPLAFNIGGATNGAFQTMIIELRVKGGFWHPRADRRAPGGARHGAVAGSAPRARGARPVDRASAAGLGVCRHRNRRHAAPRAPGGAADRRITRGAAGTNLPDEPWRVHRAGVRPAGGERQRPHVSARGRRRRRRAAR